MKTLKNRLNEKLENFYLMEGDDYYLYDRAFSMIKKESGITIEDFNIIKFDDENYSMQQALDACEVMPMGDNKKIVLIKNVAKVSENDKNLLEKYLKNPLDSTILIIFDFVGKFVSFKDKSAFVDCNRLEQNIAMNFVAKEFSKRDKQISREACEKLLEMCNGYLTKVVNEIDKLAYYDTIQPLVTKKMVEELVIKDREYIIYELTEALGQRKSDKALEILDRVVKEQGILTLIINHFRRLFFISTSQLDDKALASMLGVKEFAIKKQKLQTKNFSKMQLKKIYAILEEVDFNLKSGAMTQENALYFLVLSILYI